MVDTATPTTTMTSNRPQLLPMSSNRVHRPPNYTYASLAKNRPAILETDQQKKEEKAPLAYGSTAPVEHSEGKALTAEAKEASSAQSKGFPTEVVAMETDEEKKEEKAPIGEESTTPVDHTEGKALPAELKVASSKEIAQSKDLPTEVVAMETDQQKKEEKAPLADGSTTPVERSEGKALTAEAKAASSVQSKGLPTEVVAMETYEEKKEEKESIGEESTTPVDRSEGKALKAEAKASSSTQSKSLLTEAVAMETDEEKKEEKAPIGEDLTAPLDHSEGKALPAELKVASSKEIAQSKALPTESVAMETDQRKKEEKAPLADGSTVSVEHEEREARRVAETGEIDHEAFNKLPSARVHSEGKAIPAEVKAASSEETAQSKDLPTEVTVSPEPAPEANHQTPKQNQVVDSEAASKDTEDEMSEQVAMKEGMVAVQGTAEDWKLVTMKEGTVAVQGTAEAWKLAAATGYRDWCVATIASPPVSKYKYTWKNTSDETFPTKVHRMLEELDYWGINCCNWQPHGRAFKVNDKERFVLGGILGKYFEQSKLTSFQRQLNIYGFKRISAGPDKQAYYHELFLRQRPQLVSRMVRFVKKGVRRQPSFPDREPNLYSYPYLPENPTKVNDDNCSVSSDHSSISWTL